MKNNEYTMPFCQEITEQECETISGGYTLFPLGFWDRLPPSERTLRFNNYRNLAPKISIGFSLGPIQFSWF